MYETKSWIQRPRVQGKFLLAEFPDASRALLDRSESVINLISAP